MSLIKIQPEAARQQSSRFSQAAADLTNMHWEVNRLANQLDWEVRGKGRVEANISSAASLGKTLYQEAQRLSDYLKTCASGLEEADAQGQQRIASTANIAASLSTGAVLGVGVAGTGVLAGLIAGGRSFGAAALGWIRGIFGWGDDSSEASYSNNVTAVTDSVTMRVSSFKKEFPANAYPENKFDGEFSDQQCKGFVRRFYKEVYNNDNLPQTDDSPRLYQFKTDSSEQIKQVGQRVSTGEVSAEQVKALFEEARPGDIVQMKWNSGTPHSAIYMGYTKDEGGNITGIQLYDANMRGTSENPINDIQLHGYSFEEYASRISKTGNGATIYTPATESAYAQTSLTTPRF